jgi:hypothetical protein
MIIRVRIDGGGLTDCASEVLRATVTVIGKEGDRSWFGPALYRDDEGVTSEYYAEHYLLQRYAPERESELTEWHGADGPPPKHIREAIEFEHQQLLESRESRFEKLRWRFGA